MKIPTDMLQMGAKAADAFKRADDIVAAVGGTARNFAEREGMRSLGIVGGKVDAVKITAETFGERLKVAVAKEFGDANLYRAAGGKLGSALDHVVPKLVESTPLGRIPASVRLVSEDVQYVSEKVHESIDGARETAGRVLDGVARVSPFG
ncbi:hypothetical protein PV703_19485 [Streptomyces sp. ME01-24h]|nr:hypothetical protein [Streptomyces sp. ME19-03-3]MDX3355448.1 hypothetical protein [Streptomyces sp. ME01-24h]